MLRHLFKVIENFICSVTETRHCHPPCKNKCSSITEIICGLCMLLTTLCCSKVINSLLVHTPSSHEKHIIKGVESKPARFLFFSVVVRSHIHLYDVWLVWMDLLCVWPKACVWSVCLVWRAGENVFLHCASEWGTDRQNKQMTEFQVMLKLNRAGLIYHCATGARSQLSSPGVRLYMINQITEEKPAFHVSLWRGV